MADNVTALPGIVPEYKSGEPDPACIAILEEALARARAGDTVGVALVEVASGDNDRSPWAWGGTLRISQILGLLRLLEDDVVRAYRDDGA
jgi:hypothetical protein